MNDVLSIENIAAAIESTGLAYPAISELSDGGELEEVNEPVAVTQEDKYKAAIEAANNLKANSVLLDLKFKRSGITAGVDADLVDVGEANKQYLRMGKFIIRSSEYNAIASKEAAIRSTIKLLAVPDSKLRGGLYRIPLKLVEKVNDYINQQITERQELIETFMAAYPKLVIDAEAELGTLYNPDDYPLEWKMRAGFDEQYEFTSDDVPEKLKKINANIFAEQSKKASLRLANEIDDIQKALRLELLNLVDKVKEAFEPSQDGKAKRFSNVACDKLKEFCVLVKDRNLTGDIQIDKLADSVQGLLNGIDPKTIKGSDKAQDILTELSTVSESLHELTEVLPVRKFSI